MIVVIVLVDLAHQGFAVGVGDLVVVGVDFVEGQEAVAVAAVFHESRLQAGLYAGDLGQVDVAAQLFLGAAFEIELFNPRSIQDDDTRFFRVGGVDQHSLRHKGYLRGALWTLSPGAGCRGARAKRHPPRGREWRRGRLESV